MSQRYLFKGRKFKHYYRDELPERTGTVELVIDWESIVTALGHKAAFNRSRTSKLQIGIKARFIPTEPAKAQGVA